MRGFVVVSLGLLFSWAQPVRADFISQVLGNNPQGFWILNDAPGGIASAAVDSSGHGFEGTYEPGVTEQGFAGPSWVPGSGLVADFTGGTVSFTAPLNLGSNGYTIEAWIDPTLTSLTQTSRIVASGSGANGYAFGTADGGGLIFTTFSQRDYFTTGVTLLPNQWQYVGVVLDASGDADFYVNGVLEQTVAGVQGTIAPTANFTLGNESPGVGHSDEIYTGGMAGVSVYTTALTSDQIQAQFDAATVPEPSSLALAFGAFCTGFALRRSRS